MLILIIHSAAAVFCQVTLDLCQLEATANIELVEPHLDRMQKLIEDWNAEVSFFAFLPLNKPCCKGGIASK